MVGAYWEPSSELEWELVSGILGGGIGNLMNVELAKWVAVESIQKKNESIQLVSRIDAMRKAESVQLNSRIDTIISGEKITKKGGGEFFYYSFFSTEKGVIVLQPKIVIFIAECTVAYKFSRSVIFYFNWLLPIVNPVPV